MNSKKIRRISASLIGVLLLIYASYQFYMATKKGIKTETVTYSSVVDAIQVKAMAVREEIPVTVNYQGMLSYVIGDGSNIAKDNIIAKSYPTESGATIQTRLSRIEDEISVLEKLLSPGDQNSYISNPSLIGTQIYTALDTLSFYVQSQNFSQLSAQRDIFHLALSRKNIIAQKESINDYSSRLDLLKSEKTQLESQAENETDIIYAPVAGYFSNYSDGYEDIASIEEMNGFSVSQAKELLAREPKHTPKNTIGKIITGFNWYFLTVLPDYQAAKLQGIEDVEIEIPYATNEKIPAKIVVKNHDAQSEETFFLFKCDYMNPEIAKIRNETIQITLATYEGLLVNEKSILFEDYEKQVTDEKTGLTETVKYENVKGVYIKNGAQIKFVQIFTDKSLNGYAICKTNLSDEEKKSLVTGSTVSLYDEVIVGGTDLYDGKLIM